MNRRVLVIGAAGQLGSAICCAFADDELVTPTSAALNVTDAAAVARVVRDVAPTVIINCAAFNNVDAAEEQPVVALDVNAFAVQSLARAAADVGARLVHYGTDFVFDGTANTAYTEDVAPAPKSTYGASKLLGEWLALEGPALVLRVESLFGTPPGWTGRRGTIDGIVEGLRAGRDVAVFTDRVVSPSYVVDIAAATRALVAGAAASGVYHCVNSGSGTWHEVAVEIAAILGVEPRFRLLTMADVTLKAPRPRFCALDNRKLAAAGFPMPTWQDALRRWLAAGPERAR